MPTSPSPDLDVTFYDHLQPIATAGVYTVEVEHRLTKDGERVDTEEFPLPTAKNRYEISATQFVLDPTAVHAAYPSNGASGLYTGVLPHITLDRAILPWERELQGLRRIPERSPWLALLVFAAGELEDDPEAVGEAVNRTVAELLHPADEPATTGPDIGRADAPESLCRTIDVPVDVFHAVVAREDELRYLTHVRDVRLTPQRRDNGELFSEGEFSVIAANRFPREPGPYVAHLVSLEGFLGRLDPDSLPDADRVRLCSLWSWTFTNDPVGSLNPAELLQHLVAPSLEDREELALRQPVPPGEGSASEEIYVRRRLHHGYSAVPYRVLSGEHTYAWYRGPCTPLTAPELPNPVDEGPHTTADHALIYDREYGLFDVSYAAAWTLGRTIALADPDYTGEVSAARRELANLSAKLSAVSDDPVRALHDPAAPAGAAALDRLAAPGFGSSLIRALKAPRVPEAPVRRARRAARKDARGLLAEPRTRALLAAAAEARTPTLPGWIERLGLLRGVPFAYLVPDPRMLPPETLRAFRIDKDWIRALIAGACDVGAHTSVDRDLHPMLRARVARTGRDGLGDGLPAAGLLLNSELVRAWPVFDIIATRGAAQELCAELRREHLAPDILLVLWDEVPDQVTLREPGQGIHFGLTSIGAGESRHLNLRHLDGKDIGIPNGEYFPPLGEPDVFSTHLRRAQDGREPDVLDLRGPGGDDGMIRALRDFLGLAELTPSQFALELVNNPLEQLLLPALPTGEAGNL